MRRAEPVESEVEARDRGFLGIAPPPRILAQPPADLKVAGVGSAIAVHPLEAAKAEQCAIRLSFDQPEGVTVVALIRLDTAEPGLMLFARPDSA